MSHRTHTSSFGCTQLKTWYKDNHNILVQAVYAKQKFQHNEETLDVIGNF